MTGGGGGLRRFADCIREPSWARLGNLRGPGSGTLVGQVREASRLFGKVRGPGWVRFGKVRVQYQFGEYSQSNSN